MEPVARQARRRVLPQFARQLAGIRSATTLGATRAGRSNAAALNRLVRFLVDSAIRAEQRPDLKRPGPKRSRGAEPPGVRGGIDQKRPLHKRRWSFALSLRRCGARALPSGRWHPRWWLGSLRHEGCPACETPSCTQALACGLIRAEGIREPKFDAKAAAKAAMIPLSPSPPLSTLGLAWRELR